MTFSVFILSTIQFNKNKPPVNENEDLFNFCICSARLPDAELNTEDLKNLKVDKSYIILLGTDIWKLICNILIFFSDILKNYT